MRVLTSTLVLLGLGIGLAPALRASTTFSFTSGNGTSGGLCPSGAICFGSGAVTATAWQLSNTGASFSTASLGQYSGGLGVCDTADNTTGCGTPQHAIDNNGYFDFVLLTFTQPISAPVTLALNTFGQPYDTDITYFVGNCTPSSTSCNPSGKTVAQLSTIAGFSGTLNAHDDIYGPTGNRNVDLNLTGTGPAGVNWILVGATTNSSYSGNDYFKLNAISYSSAVPEPATFGLAGAALLGLGLLRAKKRRSGSV